MVAEMPEAEGRELDVERSQWPADAVVHRFIYRGDAEALLEACRPANAILTDYVPFTDAVLARLPGCRIVSVAATGWDCVDTAAAARYGISVTCVDEYCTDEVADHTLALLLALSRRLLLYDRQVRVLHDWRWNSVRGAMRLAGRTLGIIGFGRIGRAVARRASAFGLRIVTCDPRLDEASAREAGVEHVSLPALLEHSDIISLHCNLDSDSVSMLDAAAFAAMRRTPLLINVARGGLIDERALLEALQCGQVAGAALDVLAEDTPDVRHHPLAGRDDVILTPHVAFCSEASLEKVRSVSAANIGAFLAGDFDRVSRFVHHAGHGSGNG